jgi:hypothetical protein
MGKSIFFGLVAFVFLFSARLVHGDEAPAGPHSTQLVPTIPSKQRTPPDYGNCNSLDEVQRKAAFTESEKLAARLLVATTAFIQKYESVKNAKAMQDIPIADGKHTALARRLIELYDGSSTSGGKVDQTAGMIFSTGFAAFLAFYGSEIMTAEKSVLLGDFRLGLSSVAAGALSGALIFGGRSSGLQAFQASAGEFPISRQKAILDSLDEGIAGPAKFLGDTLDWSADQRSRFSKALKKRVFESFKKTVLEFEEKPHPLFGEPKPTRIAPKLVASLESIDFLEILRLEGLATEDEMKALQTLQTLQEQAQKLHEDLAPSQAKEILAKENGVGRNRMLLARLHRLLQQVESELPEDSSAKAEAKRLGAESERAISVIKKLCELGG